jgi:hypothetical protein
VANRKLSKTCREFTSIAIFSCSAACPPSLWVGAAQGGSLNLKTLKQSRQMGIRISDSYSAVYLDVAILAHEIVALALDLLSALAGMTSYSSAPLFQGPRSP